jgi:hypothetical protein
MEFEAKAKALALKYQGEFANHRRSKRRCEFVGCYLRARKTCGSHMNPCVDQEEGQPNSYGSRKRYPMWLSVRI